MTSQAIKSGSPDFFGFVGLPRKLNIDAADLEQRYRALSRQYHPDYFYNAPAAERRASLERSSYLNDAYRTLKNPITRVEYLLTLEGLAPKSAGQDAARPGAADGAGNQAVPAALLEEVFALNEELDEIRDERAGGAPSEAWKARLERARVPIDAKREAHEADLTALSKRWDALVDAGASDAQRRPILEALRDRILERNYINNLLAGIQRELDGA